MSVDGLLDDMSGDEDDDPAQSEYARQLAAHAKRRAYASVQSQQLTQIGMRKTLLGLEWRSPYWIGECGQLFRAEGLLIPNAPPGARLAELSVGNRRILPMGRQGIWLSTFLLLEELDAVARDGCRARPHIPPMEPGILLRLAIVDADGQPLGAPLEPTIWGIAPHYL